MKATALNFPESYFENRRTIRFFFEGQAVEGFLFCVSNYLETNQSINQTMVEEMARIGKRIGLFNLEWGITTGPIAQFRLALETNPDGLIFNNLDELIEQTKGTVIETLNYAREGLMELHKPILFWLNEKHHTQFIQAGIDLYSRRAFSTLYFEDLDLSQRHGLLETRFSEITQTTEEYKKRKLRLDLLEKQLKEAEASGYPKEKIVKEIVMDLMEEYRELELVEPLGKLIDSYAPYFNELTHQHRNILGMAYIVLDKLDLARDILTGVVHELEKNNILNIPEYSDYQNNLAVVLLKIGGDANLIQAKIWMEKALATAIQRNGENSPIVAVRLNNLALVLKDLKGESNLKTAKELLNKALEIDTKSEGNSSPKVAQRLNNLAVVLTNLGGRANLLQAKKHLEMALEIDVQNFGEKTPSVANRKLNLGNVLYELRQFHKALEFVEKAYSTFLATLGPENRHTKIALSWLEGINKQINQKA